MCPRLIRQDAVGLLHHPERHRHIDEVAVLERRALAVVDAVIELRSRLYIDDQRRTPLDDGDESAAAVQVLSDVVRAGAGAEDIDGPALPFRAAGELARMDDRAAKAIQGRDLGNVRSPAHAGRHDDVPGMQRAMDAVGHIHVEFGRPALLGGVPRRALEARAGPEVDLHGLDIGFEPVRDLVLGDVFGPSLGEGQVGKVIGVLLVVKLQPVIALAPIVADPCHAIDNQRLDAQRLKSRRRRDAGMAAAHDEHRRIAIGIA